MIHAVDTFCNHFVRLPRRSDDPEVKSAVQAQASADDFMQSAGATISSANARQEALLPKNCGGNQIVMSSRIAGYHAAPLKGHIAHFTIEPMSLEVVETFVLEWLKAVSNADPDLISVLPSNGAEQLITAVRNGGRGLKDLATNPLLLSVLCSIFVSNSNELPQCRVEIYDVAMESLLNVWRARQLKTSVGHLTSMLSSLAEHIHTTSSTGLIAASEARALVAKRLRQEAGKSDDDVFEQADEFLRIAKEEVGLLAARGERLYGFIHLTFQGKIGVVDSEVDG